MTVRGGGPNIEINNWMGAMNLWNEKVRFSGGLKIEGMWKKFRNGGNGGGNKLRVVEWFIEMNSLLGS